MSLEAKIWAKSHLLCPSQFATAIPRDDRSMDSHGRLCSLRMTGACHCERSET